MALDFPSSPVNGQVYDNFIYDATKNTWKSISSGASPNYLVNPTITNAVITATAPTASTIPLTVNGAASQSANLQEWKNSSGIAVASISSAGNLIGKQLGLNGITAPTQNADINGRIKIRSDGSVSAGTWLTGNNGVETAFLGMLGNLSSDAVGVYHGGSWQLSVDSSGRVLMPNKPAFHAKATAAIGGGADIPYNLVHVNVGNHYNSSNGRFTAPVAGYYYISAGVVINSGGAGWIVTETFINGADSDAGRRGPAASTNHPSGGEAGASASGIVYLNANDYVTNRMYSSTSQQIFVGSLWAKQRNFFTGYLLG